MGYLNKKIINLSSTEIHSLHNEFRAFIKEAEEHCEAALYINALDALLDAVVIAYENPEVIKATDLTVYKNITQIMLDIRNNISKETVHDHQKSLQAIQKTSADLSYKNVVPSDWGLLINNIFYCLLFELITSIDDLRVQKIETEYRTFLSHFTGTLTDDINAFLDSNTFSADLLDAYGLQEYKKLTERLQKRAHTVLGPVQDLFQRPFRKHLSPLLTKESLAKIDERFTAVVKAIQRAAFDKAMADEDIEGMLLGLEFAEHISASTQDLRYELDAIKDVAVKKNDIELFKKILPRISATVDRSTLPFVLPLDMTDAEIKHAIDDFNDYWFPEKLMQDIEHKVLIEHYSGNIHTILLDTPLIDGHSYIPSGKELLHGLAYHKIAQFLNRISPAEKGTTQLFLLSTEYRHGRPVQTDITSVKADTKDWLGLALRMQSEEPTFKASINEISSCAKKIERCASIIFNTDGEATGLYSYAHQTLLPLNRTFYMNHLPELDRPSMDYIGSKGLFFATAVKNLFILPENIQMYKLVQKIRENKKISSGHKTVFEEGVESTKTNSTALLSARIGIENENILDLFKKDPGEFIISGSTALNKSIVSSKDDTKIDYPALRTAIQQYVHDQADITLVLKAIQNVIDIIIDTDNADFLNTLGFTSIATESSFENRPLYESDRNMLRGKVMILMNFLLALARTKDFKYLPFQACAMQYIAVKSRQVVDIYAQDITGPQQLMQNDKIKLIVQILLMSKVLSSEGYPINADIFPLIYTGAETRFFSLNDIFMTNAHLNELLTQETFPGLSVFTEQGLSALAGPDKVFPADILDRIFKDSVLTSLAQIHDHYQEILGSSETGTGLFTTDMQKIVRDNNGYIILGKLYSFMNTVLFTVLTTEHSTLSSELGSNNVTLSTTLLPVFKQLIKYGQLLRTDELEWILPKDMKIKTIDQFYMFVLERYVTALETQDRSDDLLWDGLTELNRFSFSPFNNTLFDENNTEFVRSFRETYTQGLFTEADKKIELIRTLIDEIKTWMTATADITPVEPQKHSA